MPDRLQGLTADLAASVGVQLIPYPRMVYVEDRAEFLPEAEVPQGSRTQMLSGEEFRRRMDAGLKIPEWYSFPEVIAELHRTTPPRDRQGFTVFFTGLSGAGKSTIARALAARLMEMGGRSVTLLDGDIVRRHLSSELGFFQGTPRYQRAPHRLRRIGDHQESRYRHLRADRAVSRDPARSARDDRSGRRFHRDSCLDADRNL
jgi:Mrp family chromosome partitioning ATPase